MHDISADDRAFREDFEAGRIAPAQFDHRAHVRLAYCYLVERDVTAAAARMRAALQAFIAHHGIPPAKYHETLTRAWTLAVRHFMDPSTPYASADAFIAANPILLDSAIMLTHYSAALLFSPDARAGFVAPDLEPIPLSGEAGPSVKAP